MIHLSSNPFSERKSYSSVTRLWRISQAVSKDDEGRGTFDLVSYSLTGKPSDYIGFVDFNTDRTSLTKVLRTYEVFKGSRSPVQIQLESRN